MNPKTLILSSVMSASVCAADKPPNPVGVFSCNGYSNTVISGGKTQRISDPYQGVLNFPSADKEAFKLKSVTLPFTAKGQYRFAEEKHWDVFHILLRPVPKLQVYRQLALKTCKSIGWKCTAKTKSSIGPAVKILDDSRLKLTMADFTDIQATTPEGRKRLTMWTDIWADCIKN